MSAIVDTLYANLEADPGSWYHRLALIEALLIERRPDEAISLIEGITELPDDLDARVMAGRAFGLIDPANGLTVVDEILAESPDHPAAHFEKAFLSHRAGDIETARRYYSRAIALDPILADAKFEGKLLTEAAAADQSFPSADPRAESEVERAFGASEAPPIPADSEAEGDRDPDSDLPVDSEEKEEEKEEVFFPSPGEIPVVTLRQAMESKSFQRRSDLRTKPQPAALLYASNSHSRPMVFTPEEEYLRRFRKVRLFPRANNEGVEYDFRQSDDNLFSPAVTPDHILVGALVTEEGVPVASLQESLQRHQRLRDSKLVRTIRRNKVQSLIVGLGMVLVAVVSMTLVTLGIARNPPPQIVARTEAKAPDILETREIVQNRRQIQPVTRGTAALSAEFLKSAASSSLAVPSFEGPGTGLGMADLGANFGAGMRFGGSGNMFFGTRVRGKIAVVFDVTGSMYSSVPIVIQEIETHFRNAHVVAVHGSFFTDEGPEKLIPYKANKSLQDMVEGFSGFSESNDLDRALRRLRRCDSLELNVDDGYLQSLGRALELLMKKKSAQSIFVFSDFQDGEDKGYLHEMAELARKSRIKIVFHHPTRFDDRVTKRAYQAFADEARGEVKEGGLGRRR